MKGRQPCSEDQQRITSAMIAHVRLPKKALKEWRTNGNCGIEGSMHSMSVRLELCKFLFCAGVSIGAVSYP